MAVATLLVRTNIALLQSCIEAHEEVY